MTRGRLDQYTSARVQDSVSSGASHQGAHEELASKLECSNLCINSGGNSGSENGANNDVKWETVTNHKLNLGLGVTKQELMVSGWQSC